MTVPPMSLAAQLALTLRSICVCRHLVSVHDATGCTRCECGEFTRREENDALALDALETEER